MRSTFGSAGDDGAGRVVGGADTTVQGGEVGVVPDGTGGVVSGVDAAAVADPVTAAGGSAEAMRGRVGPLTSMTSRVGFSR